MGIITVSGSNILQECPQQPKQVRTALLRVQEEIQKYIILQSQLRIGQRKRWPAPGAQEDMQAASKDARTAEPPQPHWKKVFMLTEDGSIRCVIRAIQGTPVIDIRSYYQVRLSTEGHRGARQ